MDTDIYILYIKEENVSGEIAKDVETRFDTYHKKLDRPLLTGKIIRPIKDKSGGKIMTEFAASEPK